MTDNPLEPLDPLELRRQVRNVLARMELVSHGSTYGYNSSGGGGESTRAMPPGELRPMHLEWRERFAVPMGDDRRQKLLDEAKDALKSAVKRTEVEGEAMDDEAILKDQILTEGKGWDAKDVARHFRCTPSYVIETREAAARDTSRPFVRASGMSRAGRAAELQDEGLSQEAIAIKMGMSQPSVHRLLKGRHSAQEAA